MSSRLNALRNLVLLLACCMGLSHAALSWGSIKSVSISNYPSPATDSALEDPPPEMDGAPSIWVRIREGFQFDLSYSNPRIEKERQWYLSNPDYLETVFNRADPFLYYMLDEAERRRMPTELVLLPVVESAFDPFAYSHGRASGIWQFIPGTGKRFGLKQNWWYDGRRDVVASTGAAMTYMRSLHKMFKGNWLHALASYNAGEGNVLRAVRANESAGRPTRFWALDLPKETEVYVPRLIALAQIVASPERYGVTLNDISNQPRIATVNLDGQLDLSQAARLAGISVDEVYHLNAGFNRWATDPEGPHRLVLPIETVESFKSNYRKLPAKDRIQWVRHTVRPGDNLLALASRYRTTPEVIRKANQMASNTIRVGSGLMIPTATRDFSVYSQSADNRLSQKQSTQPKAASLKRTHRVASGDTLWGISQKYKVSTRQLASWNGMAPGDPLKAGRTLVVWQKGGSTSPSNTGRGVIRKVGYQIRSGDSLSSIASRFNVSVNDLVKWNPLNRSSVLKPGQHIRIYVDVTAGREQGT